MQRTTGIGAAVVMAALLAFAPAPSFCQDLPAVQAASAVLMDADTRVVLFERAVHERRPVASTTKVMTALLALEHAGLSDPVIVSGSVLSIEGSNVGLQPGDTVAMDDLLKSLLLASGNDAAVAIAEHLGGSVAGFAEMMNARAAELGATDSHFANPHGLYDANHYSSAYDLGIITSEAFRHPRFTELVGSKVADATLPSAPEGVVQLINHNKLLWRSSYVDGVKTGFVKESGHCLIASGSQDGWRLIAVVLDSPDMYADAQALLKYGFTAYGRRVYAKAGDIVGRARVSGGKRSRLPAVCKHTLALVTGPGLADGSRLEVALDRLKAPVAKGARVGTARLLSAQGEVLVSSPLVAGEEVRRSWLKLIATWLVRVALALTAFVFVVRTCAKIVKARRRRRRIVAAQGSRPDPSRARPG
ncbi:MAG: D-alanyl-D-alanine carboxypeptidase family protein [Armatimonadota bacterium]